MYRLRYCRSGWSCPIDHLRTPAHFESRRHHHRRNRRSAGLLLPQSHRVGATEVLFASCHRVCAAIGANQEELTRLSMSTFERYLTAWVVLCIVAGVALGHAFPDVFQAIGGAEIAKVNLPVAVLIWLMIIPMLVKIDFSALGQVKEHWRGIGVTLF